jgi:hypothetical protein
MSNTWRNCWGQGPVTTLPFVLRAVPNAWHLAPGPPHPSYCFAAAGVSAGLTYVIANGPIALTCTTVGPTAAAKCA